MNKLYAFALQRILYLFKLFSQVVIEVMVDYMELKDIMN